jgi:GntR family transcriptional repressor for pyruvate dehydrogenase complex
MRLQTRSKGMSATLTADLVGDLIAEQDLRPGERLPSIRDIAARFNVKAGVVRDALIAAQTQGLIKVLPRLGAIVQQTTNEPSAAVPSSSPLSSPFPGELREILPEQDPNLFHVLDAREVLELGTVARASRRRELPDLFKLRELLKAMAAIPVTEESPEYVELDVQFHLEIARLSGNAVMMALLGLLFRDIKPHLARIRWSVERRCETNASHARIYSALVAGDVELAQREMRSHLQTAFNSLLDEMRAPPKMNGNHG